jgi:hypothetical protein
VIRFVPVTALGLATTQLLFTGVAAAQQPPAPGVPAAATAPPPPPPPPTVAGAATSIQGVTPAYMAKPEFKSSRREGWAPQLSFGVTAAFANNSGVAGQVDGSSVSAGIKIDAALDYNTGAHEWRNTLGAVASLTRTPAIDEFFKTSDALSFDTIYLYHVVSWFGPFLRASVGTSMFRGADVRPAPVTYQITRADGTLAPTITAKRLSLSDPLRPTTLKQSVGLFVQPYRSDPFTFEIRGGAGAQEVFADHQLTVKDDAATPVIEVQELKSVNQLGPELALSLWGSFVGKKITYKANADVMIPFVHTPGLPSDMRTSIQFTNIQLDGTISYRLVSWASLDYQFKALRQPEVIDNFQIQNTLLLTFGGAFVAKPPTPASVPAPPPPHP